MGGNQRTERRKTRGSGTPRRKPGKGGRGSKTRRGAPRARRRPRSGSSWARALDAVAGPGLRTRLVLCAALFFLLGWQVGYVEAAPPRYTHAEIIAALRMVESSGRDDPPDGDGGRSIGPYQIQRSYWQDAGCHTMIVTWVCDDDE